MAGRSCFGMAKQSLETWLVEAVRSGDACSVKHLLNKGAHVNAVVASGETAIGVAAQNGDVTILRLLLDFDNVCHSDAAIRSSSTISNNKTCHSDVAYVCDRSTKGNDYCNDKRTFHSDAVCCYDDADTNNYSTSPNMDKRRCHSDMAYDCERSSQRNRFSDKRSGHSDAVRRYNGSDTNKYSANGTKTDKSRCHSDAELNCDRSTVRSNTITDKRTYYREAACDPSTIGNTNSYYGQRASHSDAGCVHNDSAICKINKEKRTYHSDAACVYNRSTKGNDCKDKRTGHSDVACDCDSSSNGVNTADKRRCHSDAACGYDRSTVGYSNTDQRTFHSDAVDNVRTSSANNVSDKNNCGYFVVYHEDVCEQDENENCNLEGRTPEGMDQLEWDVEVRDCEVKEEDDVWSCQYRWYADILDRTQCHVDADDSGRNVRLGRSGDGEEEEEKCEVNLQDVHGCTALHYAAGQGHLEAVRLLIEAGGQVDICDAASQTPLHLAAAHGHTQVVEQLIEACQGASRQQHLVNVETGDSRRMTALHFAAARGHWRTCAALVAGGAHINALDSQDRTPLYSAVARHHLKTARLLLRHGANANIEDVHGFTAMCEAVWSKNVAMVGVLAQGPIRLCPSHQLLHYAVLHRHAAMVAQLLPLRPQVNLPCHEGGDTPLMLAARTSQLSVVGLLLKHGAKANTVNAMSGCTPLMAAVESLIDYPSYLPRTMTSSPPQATPTMTSSPPPSAALTVTSSFEAMVRLLVAYGADLNHCGAMSDYTPLTKLIMLKKFSMAAFLIRIGADVNKCKKMGDYVFDNLVLARNFKQFTLVQMIVYAGYELTREKLDQLMAVGTPKRRVAIDSWLQHTYANVWPLTHLCRLVIRKQLVSHCGSRTGSYGECQSVSRTELQNVSQLVSRTASYSESQSVSSHHCDPTLDTLPIPNLLKRFIRMEDFEVEDNIIDQPPSSSASATTSSLFI